jgi:hypothetical protein
VKVRRGDAGEGVSVEIASASRRQTGHKRDNSRRRQPAAGDFDTRILSVPPAVSRPRSSPGSAPRRFQRCVGPRRDATWEKTRPSEVLFNTALVRRNLTPAKVNTELRARRSTRGLAFQNSRSTSNPTLPPFSTRAASRRGYMVRCEPAARLVRSDLRGEPIRIDPAAKAWLHAPSRTRTARVSSDRPGLACN